MSNLNNIPLGLRGTANNISFLEENMNKKRSLENIPDELLKMRDENPIVRAFIDKYLNWGFQDVEEMTIQMSIFLAKEYKKQHEEICDIIMNNPSPIYVSKINPHN